MRTRPGSIACSACARDAPGLGRGKRARGRHAAITKNLYTWSNYKNWADKMKDSFDEPGPPLPPKK
jgi:hypothetical protein